MNNNRSDERALQAGCKGVFSTAGYITIGTKGKPEEYVKPSTDHARFSGKQIATAWPKGGRTVNTYFEKEHKWVFGGCKFNDRLMYAKEQAKPARGFLTSDFHRRDEFSLDFRTEQYREQLKLESKHAARALQLLRSQAPATAAAAAAGPPVAAAGKLVEGRDKPFLYDLVYDAADASHSGASKLHRDSKNPTWHTRERRFGPLRTAAHLAHGAPDASCFGKPQFANKPVIRDTFFRKTNIMFPPGCAVGQDDDALV